MPREHEHEHHHHQPQGRLSLATLTFTVSLLAMAVSGGIAWGSLRGDLSVDRQRIDTLEKQQVRLLDTIEVMKQVLTEVRAEQKYHHEHGK